MNLCAVSASEESLNRTTSTLKVTSEKIIQAADTTESIEKEEALAGHLMDSLMKSTTSRYKTKFYCFFNQAILLDYFHKETFIQDMKELIPNYVLLAIHDNKIHCIDWTCLKKLLTKIYAKQPTQYIYLLQELTEHIKINKKKNIKFKELVYIYQYCIDFGIDLYDNFQDIYFDKLIDNLLLAPIFEADPDCMTIVINALLACKRH
ncbi:MAG: hypothetical protein HAW62_00510 [Endozoicomonadaceae bacterium]|nr:hypothetical protein [Endozoicomonadaceae bacterium]